jgi:hypothetical protein
MTLSVLTRGPEPTMFFLTHCYLIWQTDSSLVGCVTGVIRVCWFSGVPGFRGRRLFARLSPGVGWRSGRCGHTHPAQGVFPGSRSTSHQRHQSDRRHCVVGWASRQRGNVGEGADLHMYVGTLITTRVSILFDPLVDFHLTALQRMYIYRTTIPRTFR